MIGPKQRVRKLFSRALALMLCAALLFTMAGCGHEQEESQSGTPGPETGETGTGVTGRYVEKKLTLPETDGYLWKLSQYDGVLYLQGSEGMWQSEDDGQSWQEYTLDSPLKKEMEAEGFQMGNIVIGSDGTRIIPMSKSIEDDEKFYAHTRYIVMDKDGGERELTVRLPASELYAFMKDPQATPSAEPDPEEYATDLARIVVLEDGSLAGTTGMSEIVYHVDQNTGEVLHTIQPEPRTKDKWIMGLAATPTSLLVTTQTTARLFDLETWEERRDTEYINEFILGGAEVMEDGSIRAPSESRRFITLCGGGQEDAYYFVDSNGLYRYMPGGVSIEQLMDSTLTTLSMQDMSALSVVVTEEHGFRVLFSIRGESQDDISYGFYSYDFDKDALLKPSEELEIYSLYESETLSQAIAVFQQEHKDILVTYRGGITADDMGAVTTSDALRQLNTEIMADKGPDIIMLDGMPIENYQNKGLLMDVTDVLEDAAGENELLRNITDAYSAQGKVFAVPTAFSMPVIIGDKAYLDKITSLDSLADTVEELRAANKEINSITGYRIYGWMMRSTAGMMGPTWVKDGEADWDNIERYYDNMKRMFDADNGSGKPDPSEGEDGVYHADGPIWQESDMGLSITLGESLLELRSIQTLDGIPTLMNVMDEHPEITYKPLENEGSFSFTPQIIMGVSAKSRHPEEAKKFVRMMLSKDMQKYNLNQGTWSALGLPVNISVVREQYEDKLGKTFTDKRFTGGMDDFREEDVTKRYPTEEELEELFGMMKQLNTADLTQDSEINDAVCFNCYTYFSGEKTKEEALAKAREELDLYLAES